VYSAARMRAVQELRDLAGDDVDLVAVGQRNQDVGVGDAGGFEHRGVGGIAGHRAHVDAVLQFAQRRLVDVDNRDFVGRFARQAVRGAAADLADAENQYFHACPVTPSRAGRR
jgi:hypothetical protein